jgi:hypothetical protein
VQPSERMTSSDRVKQRLRTWNPGVPSRDVAVCREFGRRGRGAHLSFAVREGQEAAMGQDREFDDWFRAHQ